MDKEILVIDDDPELEDELGPIFRRANYSCAFLESGEEGVRQIELRNPWMVFCDVIMPGLDGLDLLDHFDTDRPSPIFVMMTRSDSVKSAVLAFRRGADDYVQKPINETKLLETIEAFAEDRNRDRYPGESDASEEHEGPFNKGLIRECSRMKELTRRIKKLAPTEANVMIQGETGVGKELVARALHQECYSSGSAFIPVNCGALADQLLASELFGHVEGAFTGATSDKTGYFEAATGGTLFLDEIADISSKLQVKLLRAIENNVISPVGSVEQREVNPRIIAATNQDCKKLVRSGALREDLFYRLNVLHIEVPPLRRRKEDIPLLVEYFIKTFNRELSRNVRGISDAALEVLNEYSWPGNVRELRNVVERAVILTDEGIIEEEDLSFDRVQRQDPSLGETDDLKKARERFERRHIRSVLERVDGDRTEAAKRLGIDPSTLYRKLKEE